jgi:hypothetical protein
MVVGIASRRQWAGCGGSPTERRPGGHRPQFPVHPAGPGRRPGARQLSPAPTHAERLVAALPLVKRGADRDRHVQVALVHATLAVAAGIIHPGEGNTAV